MSINTRFFLIALPIFLIFLQSAIADTNCSIGIDQSHRGSQLHPENTLEAVRAAFEQGFASVEVDVQRLADGTWVLHHDPIIGRVVRVKGKIGRGTGTLIMADWRDGLTVNKDGKVSSAKPALLGDLLDVTSAQGGHLNIEIKGLYSCAEIRPMISQVKAAIEPRQLMFSSIDQNNLNCVRQAWPTVTVAWVIAPSAQTIKAQYGHYADQFSSLGRVLGFSIQKLLAKAEQNYETRNNQALSQISISEFAAQFSAKAAVHVDQYHLKQYDWLAAFIRNKGLDLGVYNITSEQARTLNASIGYCPAWAIVDH
jgi:glycerophosphoryl diester phosphodiesterase